MLRLQSVSTAIYRLYADISTRRPHAVAGTTACCIVGGADLTCQATFQWDPVNGIDWQRFAGITAFATWHYGVPAKWLYLWYDRFFGVAPNLRTAATKMAFDVYVHSPLLLVPSFYLITGAVKGQSLAQIGCQLRDEWVTASFGTALFWTPLCVFNFRLVPQDSRILVVSVGSFLHKTWMSWLSNRARHQQRIASDGPDN